MTHSSKLIPTDKRGLRIVNNSKPRTVAYLASPYSHEDPVVRMTREHQATAIAAKLILDGWSIIAPITQSHRMAQVDSRLSEEAHDLWMSVDVPLVEAAEVLIVAKLDGWETSKGVLEEIAYATEAGKKIFYVNHEGELLL